MNRISRRTFLKTATGAAGGALGAVLIHSGKSGKLSTGP